jgi:DNA polymerase III epsilon subunit-like protein
LRQIFFDTETGGLDPKVNAITQIAAIAFDITGSNVDGFHCVVAGAFNATIKPAPWLTFSAEALELSHKSLQKLQQHGISEGEAYKLLRIFMTQHLSYPDNNPQSWLEANKCIGHLWAHEASFDHGFLCALEKRVLPIENYGLPAIFSSRCDFSDSKALYHALAGVGAVTITEPVHLAGIASHYGIPYDQRYGLHDALVDARLGVQCLGAILNDYRKHF